MSKKKGDSVATDGALFMDEDEENRQRKRLKRTIRRTNPRTKRRAQTVP